MQVLFVLIAIIVLIVGWIIATYNSLVTARNRVEEALSDITVQLKRRFDLIPNLVETVKGYAKHEQETLEKVIVARNQAMQTDPNDIQASTQADNALSATLKSIFALSESYPDLKANQNFLDLQNELTDAENKIQASRRFYNNNVRVYTTKTQTFPTNIIADQLHFKSYNYYEVENQAEVEKPVEVKF
ncbi:LemA family protein [Candidatus Saccharibacteria bacterium]|nr:LemA family protein [Candidatus Saccharibacteria bacterium]